jgi:hypothetical protein
MNLCDAEVGCQVGDRHPLLRFDLRSLAGHAPSRVRFGNRKESKMRLGTHIRAARTAKGLTVAASSLISGLSHQRWADIEDGDRLPTGDELVSLTTTNGIDSQTVFLWACGELMERLFFIGRDGASIPDEDLFVLWDSMVAFLAQRGRI